MMPDHDFGEVEVAVFPPFTDLRSAQTLIDAEKFEIKLGAQDISQHESGAYTGEVSGADAFQAKRRIRTCRALRASHLPCRRRTQ